MKVQRNGFGLTSMESANNLNGSLVPADGMNRRRMPSLTSLRAFEAVARHISFTKAAEELCVTQSALSHQIKILEQTLGVPLFIRGNGGIISLNEDSENLLHTTSKAFNQIEATTSQIINGAKVGCVTLTVHAPPVFSNYWLIPRLADFVRQYPNVEICIKSHFESSGATDWDFSVESNSRLDLASRYDNSETLLTTACVALCSPDLLVGGGLQLTDKLNKSTLLCFQKNDLWDIAASGSTSSRELPSKRILFDDSAALVNAGVAGHGIFLGSPEILEPLMQKNLLVTPFESDYKIYESYCLKSRKRGTLSQAANSFREWMLELCQPSESFRHIAI